MRPHLIAGTPGGENPALTPFGRFENFARKIILVPKAEADRQKDIENRSNGLKGRKRQVKGG